MKILYDMEIIILIHCIIVRLKSNDCTLEKKVNKGRFQNMLMTAKKSDFGRDK